MSSENDQGTELPHETGPTGTGDRLNDLRGRLAGFAADMAACVRFFTRLPIKQLNSRDDPEAPPDFSRISRAAPLAGAFAALPAAGVGLALGLTNLPPLAIAIIVLAVSAIVTGALHEDGLSDTADGLFGGYTRERRLEIMKDSRIGAFGALSLIFGIGLRVVLLGALWQLFPPAGAALLFLSSEAASRMVLVWQWHQHPLARPSGLAARFGRPDRIAVCQAGVSTALLLVPAALLIPFSALVSALLCAVLAGLAIGHLALDKIGGVTGDILGAIQQFSALGFLIGLVAFL